MTMLLSSQLFSLAALDDILNVLLPVIFMVLWAVGQLLSAKKRGKRPAGRPVRPGVPPGQQAGAGGQGGEKPAGRLEAALRKEVEEFLQRAQGKPVRDPPPRQPERPRQERSRKKRPASGRETAPLPPNKDRMADVGHKSLPSQVARRRPSPATLTTRPSTIALTSDAVRGASQPVASIRSQSVAAHVAAHIDRGRQAIDQQVDRLADSLEQTDERAQQRIERKFEHQLGQLQHQDKAAVEQKSNIANEIAELLRSPEGVRQMVIAKEIFDRPYQ